MQKTLSLFAGILLSLPARAGTPIPAATINSVIGTCDPAQIQTGATALAEDYVAFGITFLNRSFQALDQTVDGQQANVDCTINVDVKVPDGYRLRIDAFALEGYLRANASNAVNVSGAYSARHANGDLFADMGFNLDPRQTFDEVGDPRLSADSALGVTQGPWAAKYGIMANEAMMASDCGETVSLQSSLFLSADKAAEGAPANIALFKDDQHGVEWGWKIEPCDSDWLKGAWHSRYSVNGQWIQAGMKFFDSRSGQFTTTDWVGDLTIDHADEQTAAGSWRAQGQQGWFRFTRGHDGVSFQGSWGRQPRIQEGSWSGERP